VQLAKTALGKPVLTDGESERPSISFTCSGSLIWAATCACDAEIGVDAEGPTEFTGDSPLHRISTIDEYAAVGFAARGDKSEAAALLWSVKESYVKALGCGFHLFDPLQVRIESVHGEGRALCFMLSLSEKGQERLFAHCSRGSDCVESESSTETFRCLPVMDHRIGIECPGQMAYAKSQRVGATWLSITTVDKKPFVLR
jgi:phosphopantetheinyl transferase